MESAADKNKPQTVLVYLDQQGYVQCYVGKCLTTSFPEKQKLKKKKTPKTLICAFPNSYDVNTFGYQHHVIEQSSGRISQLLHTVGFVSVHMCMGVSRFLCVYMWGGSIFFFLFERTHACERESARVCTHRGGGRGRERQS